MAMERWRTQGRPGVTGPPEYRLMTYQFQYLCMLMLNLDPGLIKLNYELRLIFNWKFFVQIFYQNSRHIPVGDEFGPTLARLLCPRHAYRQRPCCRCGRPTNRLFADRRRRTNRPHTLQTGVDNGHRRRRRDNDDVLCRIVELRQ